MFVLRQSRLLRRAFLRRLGPAPTRRRITLHIGAHKTGTTYIQHTLDRNRANLPLAFETVPRRDRDLHAIAHAAASARSESRARALEAKITHHAETLARRFDRVENLLITHEGLPGPLPGRKQMKGLYPQAQLIVPAIVAGLCASGAEVTVVFYKRRFRDWQASLYRYRFRDHPERGYNPGRFAARTGLPQGWDDVLGRLRDALRETEFSVVSFEKDRKNGLLGRALYRIWGLSDAEISRLRRLAPRNVSREKTRADHEFGT